MAISFNKRSGFYCIRLSLGLLWVMILAAIVEGCAPIPKKWEDVPAYYNTYYHFSKYFKEGKNKLILTNVDVFSLTNQRFILYPIYNAKEAKSSFENALQKAIKIIRSHSKSSFFQRTMDKLGQIYFYLDDLPTAYSQFTQLLNSTDKLSRKVNAILWLSHIDREWGNYSRAKNRLIQFLEEDNKEWTEKDVAPLQLYLAEFYANENNFEQAISLLEKHINYISSHNLKDRALLLLGHIYIEERNWQNAYHIFNRVRKKAKTPEKKYITTKNWSIALKELGDYPKAINALYKLRRLSTMQVYYPDIDLDIALLTISQGKIENGIDQIQSIIKKYSSINPITEGLVYQSLGDIYFFQYHHFKYALEAYSKAKEILSESENIEYFHSVYFAQYIPLYLELVSKREELRFLLELGLLDKSERKRRIEIRQQLLLEESQNRLEFETNQNDKISNIDSNDSNFSQGQENASKEVSFLGAYSTQLIEQGKALFRQRWEKRALIDNWRFISQSSTPSSRSNNEIIQTNVPSLPVDDQANKNVNQQWLTQVPETYKDSLDIEKHLIGIHYNIGLLFFEHFPHVDSAIYYFDLVVASKLEDHPLIPKAIVGLINLYNQNKQVELSSDWENYLGLHFPHFYSNDEVQSISYPTSDTVSFYSVQKWINIAHNDSTLKREYLLYRAVEEYILFLMTEDFRQKVTQWEKLKDMCEEKEMKNSMNKQKNTFSLPNPSSIKTDTAFVGDILIPTDEEEVLSLLPNLGSNNCAQWQRKTPYVGEHWDHIRLLLKQISDSKNDLDELKAKQIKFWQKNLLADIHG